MKPIQAAEKALRKTAQAGDFVNAESAARRYVESVQSALPHLTRSQSAILLEEACGLMEWARRCLCLARVRIRENSRGARRLAAYYRTAHPQVVYSWRIDG